MTVSTTSNEVSFTGTGSVGPYAYPWEITSASELSLIKVLVASPYTETALTYVTDYTVTGVGAATGGNITMTSTSVLPATHTLRVRRIVPVTQATNLRNQGEVSADDVERAIDKLARVDQQQQAAIDRSIRVSDQETGGDGFKLPFDRASKVLAFNADKEPIAAAGVPEAPTTAFMATVLDDETAAEARGTLGVSAAMDPVVTAATLAAARTAMGPWGDAVVTPTGGTTARSLATRFLDVINVQDFGAVGDGTDDTTAILAAISAIPAAGGTLYFPPTAAHYLISAGLDFGSKSRVRVVSSGATIKCSAAMADTQNASYPDLGDESVIRFVDASDIEIIGLTLDGNLSGRTPHAVTESYNSAIMLGGCARVRLRDCRFNGGMTDGVTLRVGASGTPCSDVYMVACICDGNRRNGISVVSCDGLLAEHCRFDNQTGVAPKAGVDVEPNNANDYIRRIRFSHCSASGNSTRGFDVVLGAMTSAAVADVDIVFEHCYSTLSSYGYYTQQIEDGSTGRVVFDQCVSTRNVQSGFFELDCHNNGISRLYRKCISHRDNTGGSTATSNSYGAAFYFRGSDRVIGNVRCEECLAIDDRAVVKHDKGFAVRSDTIASWVPDGFTFDRCRVVGTASVAGFLTAPFQFQDEATNIRNLGAFDVEKVVTSGSSVIARWSGTTWVNTGAGGSVTYTLPTAKIGQRFRFRITTAQTVKVTVQSGEQIVPIASAASRSLSSSVVGNILAVECRESGKWQVVEIVGTWTDGAI